MQIEITPEMAKSVNFMGSVWQSSETETIASNIVFVSRKINPEKWEGFTFEQYCEHCTHNVGPFEKKNT